MPLTLFLTLVYFGFFFLILALFLFIRRIQNPTAKRLRDLQKRGGPVSGHARIEEFKKQKEKVHDTVEKLLTDISRFVKQDEVRNSRMKAALIQAGYHKENSVRIFTGIKLVSAISCFLLFLLLGSMGNRTFNVVFMIALMMGFVGFIIPDVVLRFKTRKRQGQIAQTLPDALDLLVITVEAGLGLNAALMRVGLDLDLRCPALAEEFNLVNQDLRTGKPRSKALRSLSDRNQIEDLRILVGALIMADKLGTSIADTLRAQADSLRTRIRQKAEEQAAKAGIKLLFPLVFFILPALIIVVMGPGLIAVYRTFQ
ncbi:type II secretion system F family protein [bacterium]|nr:type II secretion system F family protein [bacterium]